MQEENRKATTSPEYINAMSMLCQLPLQSMYYRMDPGYYSAVTPWSQYHPAQPQQVQQSQYQQQQPDRFQSLPPRSGANDKMKLSFLLNNDREEHVANVPRPDHLILHNTIKSQHLAQVSLITGCDTPLMSSSNVSAAMMPLQIVPSPVLTSHLPPMMPMSVFQQQHQPQYQPQEQQQQQQNSYQHQNSYQNQYQNQQPLPLECAPSLTTMNQRNSLGESTNSLKSPPSNSHSLTQSPPSQSIQSSKHFWTKQEDELLVKLVEKHGPKNWDRMATLHLPHRNGSQLRARWLYNLSKDGATPSHEFTQEEDKFILSFYAEHGGSWSRMAKELGSKHNDQEVKNRFRKLERMLRAQRAQEIGSEALEFSAQDDAIIMEFVNKNGSRWTELSKLLTDRTPDEVKNRYRKLERKKKAAEGSGEL
mmetsp:Transcript_6914/g.12467  ORF Transcript_6914/g.12467 Transcript_6914/m.12467 type:complete len:420 (+) Transcript_6914:180-1439(+)